MGSLVIELAVAAQASAASPQQPATRLTVYALVQSCLAARHWACAAADKLRWRGLAVYGVHGTTMPIADSHDNEIVSGRPRSGRSAGAYPQLRLVALMVLRAHALASSLCTPGQDQDEQLPKKGPAQSRHSTTVALTDRHCF